VNRHLWLAAACASASLTLACSSPAGPGPLQKPDGGRGPADSLLKVGPPVPVSPRDGQVASSVMPRLEANNSRGLFTPGLDLLLVFEVFDEGDALVYRSAPVAQDPSNRTSHVVAVALAAGRPHSWQAIPIRDGLQGPPSARALFRTP